LHCVIDHLSWYLLRRHTTLETMSYSTQQNLFTWHTKQHDTTFSLDISHNRTSQTNYDKTSPNNIPYNTLHTARHQLQSWHIKQPVTSHKKDTTSTMSYL
jgi:hypothetical protein